MKTTAPTSLLRGSHYAQIPFILMLACLSLIGAEPAVTPPVPDPAAIRTGEAPADPGWDAALRTRLEGMAKHLTATLTPWPVPDRIIKVEEFGAVADGVTVNSAAINKAIEACSAQGGGVVLLSNGDYVSGTIDFRSGVMLEIAKGSRLLGSTKVSDYPDRIARRPTVMDSNMDHRLSLIFAEGCERIGIRGEGIIDGRGSHDNFPGPATVHNIGKRPFGIRILDCQNVVFSGIHLRNAAAWMSNFLNCDNLIIDGITVENHVNWNNDGLDIDGCRNVIVRNCLINTDDDGLCFKGASLRPTENVLVEDCKIYTACNPVKFGTDSQGDFRNVYLRNLEVGGISGSMTAWRRRPAHTGITLQAVDGGTVEDVLARNIHIVRANCPIFLRLGDRARVMPGMPRPLPGYIRRVVIEDVTGEDNKVQGSIISGIPGARITDIIIRRYRITSQGGSGPFPAGTEIPEKVSDYPANWQFPPEVPAHGFWLRHAHRVAFQDVQIRTERADLRPMISAGDNTAGIHLDGVPIRE